MIRPYILKMSPCLQPKVWGGRKLADVFHKSLPDAQPYGESWEVSDLPEGQSLVENGPLAGATLGAVVQRWGSAMTGANADAARFPLLVKILDARDDLSVQVHPSEADIVRLGLDADSKDECWIILGSDAAPAPKDAAENPLAPDAPGCILHGFDAPLTAADFHMAVDENRAAEVLRRLPVYPGEVIRVAPGTIHAICRGVTLLEIQQPSDTTYRVYDYQRPGMDGRPRALHLAQAMQVSNFTAHPPAKLAPSPSHSNPNVELLVDVPAYRIERIRGVTEVTWQVDARTPQVVFVANDASANLNGPQEEVILNFAETAVIPAGIGQIQVRSDKPVVLIIAGLGGRELVAR